MDLMSLADFNAVAQHGGFGPAARILNRPKATLSRRVAELETDLGVRLIERGARKMRLTEEGLALHERTHTLIAELRDAGDQVASRAPVPRGRLRISAPVVFSHVMLCTFAARFALAYPEVELEVIADDRKMDPVQDGYDLVIRINPAADEKLMGRRLLTDEQVLVAAPTLAVPLNALDTARVEGHPDIQEIGVPAVLTTAQSDSAWSIRDGPMDHQHIKPLTILRLSSLLMVREAVLTGVGAALLPRLLVEQDIATGRLVRWGAERGPAVEIWALYHSRRLLSAKVRAFLDMLQKTLAED